MYRRVVNPVNPKNITFRGMKVHQPFLCPDNKAVWVSLMVKGSTCIVDKAIQEGTVSLAKRFKLDGMSLPMSLI